MGNPAAVSLLNGNTATTEEPPIHVLYVDDEVGLLKAAKPILEMQGSFRVETALSVEEAMEKMEAKTFDVIVSDYIMPGKDGLEFLRELRESGNSIPFIVFTGKGREIVAIKALNLGADQYVNKIGNPETVYSELAHGIRTVVNGKKAEEALSNSEKEKSVVLDSMAELVVHQDLKHRILWVNRKAADSVNMKPEELEGRYCHEIWANSTNPCTGCPLEETIKTGQQQQGTMTTPDGRVWLINGSSIKDANGNVTSVVEVATNITEQKNAEEDLRKSEAKYRGLVENIDIGIATINLEGRYAFVNQALCKMVGYSEKEFIGRPFGELLHPDDKKRMLELFSGSGEEPDRKLSLEFRVLHKNGDVIYMHSSPTPIIYNNKIVGFNAILSDVTEHKKAEKALQESEEKYRTMIEQAPDLILTVDKKGIVTSCNAVLEKNTDFSQNEVVGKHFLETPLLHGITPETSQRVFNSILEEKPPERIEIKWFLKDGTSRISELRIGLNKKDGKIAGFTAVARDITEQKKVEEKLQESEEKFRNLAEKSPNMIFINKNGRVVYANKRCEEVMGYSREEFYSPDFDFFVLVAPESIELQKSSYSRHLNGKEMRPYEYTLLTKEGKRIEAILTSKLITYEGEPAILGIITDISEHKKVEAELRREKELMEMVTANTAAGLAIISKDFHILWANRFLTEKFGDLRGNVCYSILSDMTNVCPECGVKEIIETGKNKAVHEQLLCDPNGEKVWIEITAVPIRDKNGNLIAVSELSIDVTDQKRAEAALRESEKRFRELSDLLPEIVFETDSTGLLTLVNQAAFERFGYSQEDFDKGLNALQMLVPEDRKRAKESIARVLCGEVMGPEEYMGLRKDGTTFPFIVNSTPIMNENKPVGMRGVIVNITDRKRAEEALRKSEKKFRTIFEGSTNGIAALDPKTMKVIFANPKLAEITGYPLDELLNSTITDFVPKNQLSLIIQQFQNHVKGKTDVTRQIPVVRKDGTLIYCDVRSNFLNIGNQQHLMTFIRDITAQKNAEEALRKSEENYRETIVNSNVGIICHNPEGEVKLINPKMEQMTGFKISEIPTLHDWFEKVYPNKEERHKIRAKWFKRMSEEGEVKEGHAIITTKDGQRRNLLFNAVRLQSGDSIAFAIDITESIAAWESLDETINALMTINEKLNVVGRLTRHDVRNKLSVIANNVYLAKQKLTANPSALEYLGDIESAIGQVEKIFGFSRNYEMLGVEELSCIDVEKNVDEAAMMFSGLSTVKLVNECKGLTVMADSLLRQLFYNLIDNTLKYGEKVSRIRVYYEEEAEQLKLVYEDDGVGIPDKEKENIFRDEYGKGTGYGLYLIRKICENYDWTIQETGVLGKGAQFTMTIPKMNNKRETLYAIS